MSWFLRVASASGRALRGFGAGRKQPLRQLLVLGRDRVGAMLDAVQLRQPLLRDGGSGTGGVVDRCRVRVATRRGVRATGLPRHLPPRPVPTHCRDALQCDEQG